MDEFYKEEEIAKAASGSIEAVKLLEPIFKELGLYSYQDFLKIIHDPKYKDIKEILDKIKFNVHDKNVSRKEYSKEVIKQSNSKEKKGEEA
jgi:hypothetical protein